MSQNGQIHFKNLAAFNARFLKCVWPFWDIMHERVKEWTARFYLFKAVIETLEKGMEYVKS